ncbi:putative FBD-associated F-box protein At5g56700 [Hordeum vulgare subsp. vulgare]|uniref:putative FBD-associated F-box protein At5g56700 n=1 Tax=Hordeum vulgare subsp. vulgare TaxID=112509 RepID=UPI001D1A5162|nr:putative FBD-associated F-box protein At5g56700 [Hordeum vulgare subsp. vulgare]
MADGGASLSTAGHGGVDRFSALHDDLLRHIITLLPIRYAARTAVLASRWRYLWRSNRLVLMDADIPEPAHDAVVPRVLADHLGHFRDVILYDCRLASLDRALPGWPRLLAVKRTERLALGNRFNRSEPSSVRLLPAGILRCDSLQQLHLDYWTFPSGAEVLLPHLRALTLTRIVISDPDLECLIAACPVLKSLGLFVNSSKHVRLRSKSLIGCTLVGPSRVEEFTVTMVDTPLLERFHLFQLLNGVEIRITRAPNLRVLGYLDTRVHKLQTGNSVIASDTMVRASTVVPSVNILGLTVNFGVFAEVKMLVSFLRYFTDVVTLHIESALHDPSVTADEPSGENHAKFWQETRPVCCLRSHVKKMVIHDFRGDQNEFEFLKFVAMNAQELQSLLVVLQEGIFSSADKVTEIKDELQCLQFPTGISAVLQVSPEAGTALRWEKSFDLTVDDPFDC